MLITLGNLLGKIGIGGLFRVITGTAKVEDYSPLRVKERDRQQIG